MRRHCSPIAAEFVRTSRLDTASGRRAFMLSMGSYSCTHRTDTHHPCGTHRPIPPSIVTPAPSRASPSRGYATERSWKSAFSVAGRLGSNGCRDSCEPDEVRSLRDRCAGAPIAACCVRQAGGPATSSKPIVRSRAGQLDGVGLTCGSGSAGASTSISACRFACPSAAGADNAPNNRALGTDRKARARADTAIGERRQGATTSRTAAIASH